MDATVVRMDDTPAVGGLPGLIKKAGLTPHGLATETAIPYVTLRRRVTNPDDLRLSEMKRIADVLDITTSDLIATLNAAPRTAKAAAAA